MLVFYSDFGRPPDFPFFIAARRFSGELTAPPLFSKLLTVKVQLIRR
jgi:hypothetical protein